MSAHTSELVGWAMGPLNGADAGLDARGSWLLEPETGTGMLLYPRDWTFVERRDVAAHLRAAGWGIVPTSRFLHLATDGETVIRLLSSTMLSSSANPEQADDTAAPAGELHVVAFRRDADDQLEATL